MGCLAAAAKLARMLYRGFELPRVLVPSIAMRLGIGRSHIRTEIRRGNWRSLGRGVVLTRPDTPTRADWAAVGLALAGADAALTGWDALRVRGLGGPTPPDSHVLVLTHRPVARVVGRVRIRQTDRPYAMSMTSVEADAYPLTPVVSVARAVADTALLHTALNPVRALVASAVQRGRCEVTDLVAELHAGPRNGSRLLRLALSAVIDGARSAAEAEAAERLRRGRVPRFELNVPVVDEHGRTVFIIDVLWRELRAALEVDSREFHFDDVAWQATLARHNDLTRYGLSVTHYPPSKLTCPGWIDDVTSWLRRRARELGVQYVAGGGLLVPPIGATPAPYEISGR
jgi:hypothetical protein